MVDNKVTTEELLKELSEFANAGRQLEEGEVTISLYSEWFHVCKETARRKLNELVKGGVLKKETVLINGSWQSVYTKI